MMDLPNFASFFTHEKKLYPLLDRENDYIIDFSEQRIIDFSTGRYCARAAMQTLGHEQQAVLMNGRVPVWPDGIVGSISHGRKLCGAVVAQAACYRSVGIDIEEVSRFSPSLWNSICTDAELADLKKLDPGIRQHRVALLFTMKEAFYKFQFPLTAQYLGFKDVTVHVDTEKCSFSVSSEKLCSNLPLIEVESYFNFIHEAVIGLAFWRRSSPSDSN